jgi:hypothetical protein
MDQLQIPYDGRSFHVNIVSSTNALKRADFKELCLTFMIHWNAAESITQNASLASFSQQVETHVSRERLAGWNCGVPLNHESRTEDFIFRSSKHWPG